MTAGAPETGARSWWAPVLYLGAIALVVTIAVVGTAQFTRARVARNESAQLMKLLATVLPAGGYDNEPDHDRIFLTDPEFLGTAQPLPVYRARRGGQPAAAVITAIAPQGYVGPIRLLICILADGHVAAVRAIAHQETPGLGDRIEAGKSEWIRAFEGRSLHDPEWSGWGVRRDGGAFDQLTGATITSRAVVKAIRDAGTFFDRNREDIFLKPAAP
jgi:electron transport complex protein RnfG